jgi:cyclophilin family peptidyl-prolyl cis-trans isomerase
MRASSVSTLLFGLLINRCLAFQPYAVIRQPSSALPSRLSGENEPISRREWWTTGLATASALATVTVTALTPSPSFAAATDDIAAEVTDKIYIEIKGIPTADGSPSVGTQRIVIGLFGKEAPESTKKLKQLMSNEGLPAPCKPKEERMMQREQLEVNKVYNSCIEGQDKGVTYDFATIWRIFKGERIDVGAVAGRFVAREFPNWEETTASSLQHDRPGIVSVLRGSESGFGFTIYPGSATAAAAVGSSKENASDLNENQIVVGQVLEGLDVVQQINNVPVITSGKVNYMGLTGGPTTKSAPSRSCRYGGPMYCNENKPLNKLTIYKTGVL